MCIRAYYEPESRILAATEVKIAHEVLSVWVISERARVQSMPRCSYCCSRCHVNGNKDVLTANLRHCRCRCRYTIVAAQMYCRSRCDANAAAAAGGTKESLTGPFAVALNTIAPTLIDTG